MRNESGAFYSENDLPLNEVSSIVTPTAPTQIRSFLTETIVSTDAIQQLSPLVPDAHSGSSHVASRNFQKPLWKRRVGLAQKLLTAIPLVAGDLLAVLGCFYAVALSVPLVTNYSAHSEFFLQGIAVALVYLGVGSLLGLFPATAISPVFELKQLVTACFISFAIMISLNQLLAELSKFELIVGILSGCLTACIVPIARASTRRHCCRYRWWGERVIIFGSGLQGQAIYRFYDRARQRGLRPVGIVELKYKPDADDSVLDDTTIPYLGSLSDLSTIANHTMARWGIVAPGGCEEFDISQVMRCAAILPNIVILPSGLLLPSLWASPRECAGVMGIHVKDHLRNSFASGFKRAVDLIGASIGLILTLPLFIAVICWIKLKSPGAAFYGHKRIGLGGATFKAWKFRSMVQNADAVLDEHLERDPLLRQEWFRDHKLKNDPRVIPGIGNLLRKWSLDEIPQLWNVLIGEMSLVGPRPIVTAEVSKYDDMYPLYLRVRPGITGLWQVSGRNNTSYDQRVRLDSYYVCNWSGWLDFYIIARTFKTILKREGAY